MEFPVSNQYGELFIVATPIGNLGDLSERARQVLADADLVAAEDTRHSRKLLSHCAITTPMVSYHDHNEERSASRLVEKLREGLDVALISDAGTPLINDPGYQLVRLAREAGIRVVPVPGPSALITALSASGLATDRFIFEGFLPEKQQARRKRLAEFENETRTLVLYEAPHRIVAMVEDCVETLGGERRMCVARELSKVYETIKTASCTEILAWLKSDTASCRGEFVVCIEGNSGAVSVQEADLRRMLKTLLGHTGLNEAVKIAVELSGEKKNRLYALALELKDE